MHAFRSTARAGMTIIEVLFAIVILSGVMLSLSRFGQAFTRSTGDSANLAIASDLAMGRIGVVLAHADYGTLATTFHGTVESSSSAAQPSMEGYAGFSRSTAAVRTVTDSTDFVTVTVSVTADVLKRPVEKTVLIGAFR